MLAGGGAAVGMMGGCYKGVLHAPVRFINLHE